MIMLAADVTPALLLPLLDLALKIAFVVLLAAGAAALARRAAAATRHLLYLCALIAALALPVVGWLVPSTVGAQWRIPVPPARAQGTSPSAVPGTNTVATQDGTPTSGQAATTLAANSTTASSSPAPDAPASGTATTPKSRLTLRGIRWVMWTIYALGAAFVLGQVALGAAVVRRLAAGSRSPSNDRDAALTRSLDDALAGTGGIRPGAVRLLLAPDATPMTWGWRRPTILLPGGAETWESERQRVVLLHEAAHIARRDWPIQMLVHAICAVYWFHPLVWWASGRLRAESERACDDRVLLAGVAPDAYAALLLDIAQGIKARQPSSVSTTQFASSMARSGGLKGRLMAIVNPATSRQQTGKRRAVATLALSALCLLPISLLHLTPRSAKAEGAEAKATELKPDPSLAYYHVPENKRWTRDAGYGTTIELVGMTQNAKSTSGLQSWEPTGTPYKKPLYNDSAEIFNDYGESRVVEFAFRVRHPADTLVGVQSSVAGAMGWSGPSPDCWRDPKIADPLYYAYAAKGGLRTVDAQCLTKARSASLQMKVAAGPWQTKKTLNVPEALRDESISDSGVSRNFDSETEDYSFGNGDISFSAPMHGVSRNPVQHQRRSGFVVTDSFIRFDADIVAIDTAGVVHRPDEIIIGGGNTLRQTTVWFDEDKVPFAKIEKLRFNLRPFRTVEFRNVPLYPK